MQVIGEKDDEYDIEIHYKDTFKAFSKDKDGNLILICFINLCLTGCISAEELQFVMNHLPGKVCIWPMVNDPIIIWWKVKKWEVLRIHVMIVVDLIKRSWMIAAITPVFNLFKLNRLWMMAVCKPAEFSSTLQRPMLTNILAWLGYLLFSLLRKKMGGKNTKTYFEWWVYARQHNLSQNPPKAYSLFQLLLIEWWTGFRLYFP